MAENAVEIRRSERGGITFTGQSSGEHCAGQAQLQDHQPSKASETANQALPGSSHQRRQPEVAPAQRRTVETAPGRPAFAFAPSLLRRPASRPGIEIWSSSNIRCVGEVRLLYLVKRNDAPNAVNSDVKSVNHPSRMIGGCFRNLRATAIICRRI